MTDAAYKETRLRAFADADVSVWQSHTENCEFSAFEAMVSGLSAVVSETLSLAQQFALSSAALVLARAPESFSRAILKLVDQLELPYQMGECGRVFAWRYSSEESGAEIAKRVESIFDQPPLSQDCFRCPKLDSVVNAPESVQTLPWSRKSGSGESPSWKVAKW